MMHSFIFRFHFANRRINNKINYFCYYVIILFRSLNNIKCGRALIVQIGACVSGRSVSLLVMCSWFKTFEYFFHRRERALGLFSTTAYVNGPFLHLDTSSRYAQ